jgi:hypothetical protein
MVEFRSRNGHDEPEEVEHGPGELVGFSAKAEER